MRLLHYSDSPVEAVRSVRQPSHHMAWHGGRKPDGFWVSVEGPDDWRSWCETESFRDCDRQIAYEVILAPNHGVLIIGTLSAMLAFHAEYGVDGSYSSSGKVIDWQRVARDYLGIIIAPYRWEQRLDAPCGGWYYGWDCASGCIWDAAAIAELRQVSDGRPRAETSEPGAGVVADLTAGRRP